MKITRLILINACRFPARRHQSLARTLVQIRNAGLFVSALSVCGCASLHTPSNYFSNARTPILNCLDQYRRNDALILHARVQDPEYRRILGFPFLRVNRLLSSLKDKADNADARAQWIDYLSRFDSSAREVEWRNLPLSAQPSQALRKSIRECRELLKTATVDDQSRFEQLRTNAVVEDNYSAVKRVVGLYPIAALFVRRGVTDLHQREAKYFSNNPTSFYTNVQQTIYGLPKSTRVAHATDGEMGVRDQLGVPLVDDAQLAYLFNLHSPLWSVAQTSADDYIGAITSSAGKIMVDPKQASVYTYASFTQFEGEVLLQLNYTVWFPARTARSALDIIAGPLDGITWRVTLDNNGRVLIADSLHNCGCYYMAFPSKRLRRRQSNFRFEEDLWVPQTLPNASQQRYLLHLAAGNHYLRQVALTSQQHAAIEMTAVPYKQLKNILDGQGGFTHLFAPDGIHHDSARAERFLFWPLGIRSAGAMREFGHHAIAFVGRRHFDDPDLIERYFERAD